MGDGGGDREAPQPHPDGHHCRRPHPPDLCNVAPLLPPPGRPLLPPWPRHRCLDLCYLASPRHPPRTSPAWNCLRPSHSCARRRGTRLPPTGSYAGRAHGHAPPPPLPLLRTLCSFNSPLLHCSSCL